METGEDTQIETRRRRPYGGGDPNGDQGEETPMGQGETPVGTGRRRPQWRRGEDPKRDRGEENPMGGRPHMRPK